ncbi:hypothetical protein HOU02_gp213 [Caulobacter phage CcrBL9]|uniref:Uncharacterized protein n=1 Tax=Caulobacter phage CcrBL9 TaxID=2283270 RepID=A0A385EF88_9CAUD|nr:hypothetical protein HOU02_gp213 [Caulobacter phage CcrBL9]AXQ69512.1 hypothetical protein CcrBL9_gp488 [Caulobacter phage CcrBL9]
MTFDRTITAELGQYAEGEFERYGTRHYNLRADDYGYALGYLKHEADGTWIVYNFHRDAIGMPSCPITPFPTQEAALAWCNERYLAAHARAEAMVAQAMEIIRADLSPVERYEKDWGNSALTIVVSLIFPCEPGEGVSLAHVVHARMTIVEALTALDILAESKIYPSIVGRVMDFDPVGKHLGGAFWRRDAFGSHPGDYHLLGWRSMRNWNAYLQKKKEKAA